MGWEGRGGVGDEDATQLLAIAVVTDILSYFIFRIFILYFFLFLILVICNSYTRATSDYGI